MTSGEWRKAEFLLVLTVTAVLLGVIVIISVIPPGPVPCPEIVEGR